MVLQIPRFARDDSEGSAGDDSKTRPAQWPRACRKSIFPERPVVGHPQQFGGVIVRRSLLLSALSLVILSGASSLAAAQSTELYSGMRWRQIGPTRAGRARAVSGVASQPNVAYIGFDNGGVWRSTDYGSTWQPLFDDQSTGSIGAIAVAPSDPNIIYVGTGAGHHSPRSRDGRRHVQVDRRRKDVDASRPLRQPDDRAHRRRSEESGPAVRGGPRPPVWTECRARNLPLAGRRKDVPESLI